MDKPVRPTDDLSAFLITREARQVSEYQLFADAYRAWYGEAPDPRHLEKLFGEYLKGARLPHFVRHYSREFVQRHPECLTRQLQERQRARRLNWMIYFILLALVLVALVLF